MDIFMQGNEPLRDSSACSSCSSAQTEPSNWLTRYYQKQLHVTQQLEQQEVHCGFSWSSAAQYLDHNFPDMAFVISSG